MLWNMRPRDLRLGIYLPLMAPWSGVTSRRFGKIETTEIRSWRVIFLLVSRVSPVFYFVNNRISVHYASSNFCGLYNVKTSSAIAVVASMYVI